jgi:hypothetical protein
VADVAVENEAENCALIMSVQMLWATFLLQLFACKIGNAVYVTAPTMCHAIIYDEYFTVNVDYESANTTGLSVNLYFTSACNGRKQFTSAMPTTLNTQQLGFNILTGDLPMLNTDIVVQGYTEGPCSNANCPYRSD